MSSDSMNSVFEALASPVRRKILDVVKNHPGETVGFVCGYFEISRIAVMKHLRVLERADLVVSRKAGRTRQLFFNAVPIQMIYDRWTTEFSAIWAGGLTRVKYRIESARSATDAAKTPRSAQDKQPGKRHA
jgi:DNA-binding transcriptional ArsR family regulator